MSKQSNQRYRKEMDERQSMKTGEASKNTGSEDKTYTTDKSSRGQNKLGHNFTSPTDSTKP